MAGSCEYSNENVGDFLSLHTEIYKENKAFFLQNISENGTYRYHCSIEKRGTGND
jgi:hypothetical protein